MTIQELKKHLKQVRTTYKGCYFSNLFDFEYETDGDLFYFSFYFDYDKRRYHCATSVYHASEDNNAENPDAHTDENDYWNNDLELLINELEEDFGVK